jgi:hypothetical protein
MTDRRRIALLLGLNLMALLLMAASTQINLATQVMGKLPAANGGVPSGVELMISSGSCPSGYTEDDSFSGLYVLGTTNAAGNVGTTGGSTSYTPAGTNSAPNFTGGLDTASATTSSPKLVTKSTSGVAEQMTPTGTVSAPAFTGTAATIQPPYEKVIFCKAP